MPIDGETPTIDPIGELLESKTDSAEIVPDSINGYDRVIPTPEELSKMIAYLCPQIEQTDRDYEPIYAELIRNEKAYEGLSDLGETISIPVCKRIANQQHAWVTTSILTKHPLITVKPIDGGKYEIPSAIVDAAQDVYQTQTLSAEEAARLYESYLQYKLTEKIDFEQLVEDAVMAIHLGEAPTYWRVTADPKVRYAKQRVYQPVSTLQGPGKKISGVENVQMQDGESVDIAHVSMLNVTMPLDETNEQRSRWLAEKTPMSNSDIWEGVKNGTVDFCKPDGEKIDPIEVRKVLGFAQNLHLDSVAAQIAEIDNRVATSPEDRHDTRTVWFFWPIKRTVTDTETSPQEQQSPDQEAPEPKKKVVIEIRSLCGLLHIKARQLLNLYCNPYWHGKRPYIPFFMRKRPHRFSGTSSVGDIAPIQRLMSQIFHLQIQNGVQQNVKVFPVRMNSITWNWAMKNKGPLKPGTFIPFDDPTDINPQQLGSPVQSMAPEIQFLDGNADRLAVERDYTNIPGRTPAATVAQFEQMAKMQPQTILRGVRRSISKAVEMYLQTIAQYHIYETMPYLDQETAQITQKLIGFPREAIENHFSFNVTATGDEDSSDAKIQKTTILLQQTDAANDAAMELMNVAIDPRAPKPSRVFAQRLLTRRELLYGDLVKEQRTDWQRFVVTEEMINMLCAQADQIAQQKMQEMAQNPPPPPPPNVNISLKGDITPQQEQALMAPLTGVPNAQLSPSGPGADVSAAQPGQPGAGGPPPQPGNAGMAVPNAPGNIQAGGQPVPVH